MALARKGFELLDKKRQVLLRELAAIQGQAKQAQDDLQNILDKGYKLLTIAYMEMGQDRVCSICHNMPKDWKTGVFFHSIIGVELPLVNCKLKLLSNSNNAHLPSKPVVDYQLSDTTVSFDEALLVWREAREHIIYYAAIENSIHRLNIHIKKTQKRANALENITIPTCVARIKFIQERLEEQERDDLARLKLAKAKKSSK